MSTRTERQSSNSGRRVGKLTGPPEFEIRAGGLDLFRTVEGLQQKAGVPKDKLRRLVLKELADNGARRPAPRSASASCRTAATSSRTTAAASTARRKRSRGCSASPGRWSRPSCCGCRRAARSATACASSPVPCSPRQGSLVVITRNRRIELRPERDGTTTVVSVKPVKHPVGTRDRDQLRPGHPERRATRCPGRRSRSSWRDGHVLRRQVVAVVVRRPAIPRAAVRQRQHAGARAGRAARRLHRRQGGRDRRARRGSAAWLCDDVTREQADRLLEAAREHARAGQRRSGSAPSVPNCSPTAPTPRRAATRRSARPSRTPRFPSSSRRGPAESASDTDLIVCVNRTPVTGDIDAARDKRDIDVFGCGLAHTIAASAEGREFDIWLNITTPYMPITSDGKAPDLSRSSTRSATPSAKAVQQGAPPRRQGQRRRRTSCSTISTTSSPPSAATASTGSTSGSCSTRFGPSSWTRPARN